MKKSNRIFTTAAGIIFLAAVGSSLLGVSKVINTIGYLPPVNIPLPTLPDSADRNDNPFKKSDLLKSFSPLSEASISKLKADFTTLVADSAGAFRLTADSLENSVTLHRLHTSIMPDKYFSGKIKIQTPSAASIFLNGKKIAVKSEFDSIPKEESGSFSLPPFAFASLDINILSQTADPTLKIEIVNDNDSTELNLADGLELKPHFNINTLGGGDRVSNAIISPDGNYILLKLTSSTDGENTVSDWSLMESSSKRIIASRLEEDMEWLENKPSTLLTSRKNSDNSFNLTEIDVPSMKESILAHNLPSVSQNLNLSPDGSYAIFYSYSSVGGEKESGVMRRYKSPDDRQPSSRNRYYLSFLDLKTGLTRPLTYGGPSTNLLDISPDSKKILYSSTRETPEHFPFYESTVVELDPFTLKADTIPGFDSSINAVKYSPSGKSLFILAGPNAFGGIGLNAGEYEYANDYDIQGYIMNLKDFSVRAMTREFDPSLMSDPCWNPTDNKIYFRAHNGFDAGLYSLDPSSGVIDPLPVEVDYVRSYTVSRIGIPKIVYTGMSYDYMGIAWLLNTRNKKSTLLLNPMEEYLQNIKLGYSEPYQFTSSDGTLIDGTLTFPPDFDSSLKYPIITYYYGGTTPSTHTNHSPYTPNLFASFGYVVYTVNPSGTIGYGQEFSARHVNAWGEKTADEIIEGVKRLSEEKSFIDKDKIGCIGASYGGFMTQLLQTKTDIFAAAVSHAGISNITSYWGEGYWGYSYNAVAAAGSYPWNNPKLFTEHSPLFYADKIHTPLLLLHGTDDTNVPIGESIQLFNALKLLGREVEFITVEGQNHIILDFQKRKEWHTTIMAWFEKWLKDDPRWWNSIYK